MRRWQAPPPYQDQQSKREQQRGRSQEGESPRESCRDGLADAWVVEQAGECPEADDHDKRRQGSFPFLPYFHPEKQRQGGPKEACVDADQSSHAKACRQPRHQRPGQRDKGDFKKPYRQVRGPLGREQPKGNAQEIWKNRREVGGEAGDTAKGIGETLSSRYALRHMKHFERRSGLVRSRDKQQRQAHHRGYGEYDWPGVAVDPQRDALHAFRGNAESSTAGSGLASSCFGRRVIEVMASPAITV